MIKVCDYEQGATYLQQLDEGILAFGSSFQLFDYGIEVGGVKSLCIKLISVLRHLLAILGTHPAQVGLYRST